MLDGNTEIPLRLTANECNTILGVLSDAPWKVVAGIIAKIQGQIMAVDPAAFGDRQPAPAPDTGRIIPAANGVDHVPD